MRPPSNVEMADLIVADPIRIPGTPNLMCHRLPRLVNCVGAEIGTVTSNAARSSASVPQAGSFTAKKGRIVSHDMGGHVAAAVTYKQAGHVSPKSVPNPTVRIARFIRYESPASEPAGPDWD